MRAYTAPIHAASSLDLKVGCSKETDRAPRTQSHIRYGKVCPGGYSHCCVCHSKNVLTDTMTIQKLNTCHGSICWSNNFLETCRDNRDVLGIALIVLDPSQSRPTLCCQRCMFGCQAVVGCASGNFRRHLVHQALVDCLAQLCSISPTAHGVVCGV